MTDYLNYFFSYCLFFVTIVTFNNIILAQKIKQIKTADTTAEAVEEESHQNYYFSYGPEMKPSAFLNIYQEAVFIEVGCLQDSRIDFINYDPENNDGGTVTVCEHTGVQVCGVVYKITPNIYRRIQTIPPVNDGYKKLVYNDIVLNSGVTISAIFLTELMCPPPVFPGVGLPYSDLPSHHYVKNLIESGLIVRLPDSYLKDIYYISDNSFIDSTR